VIICTRVQILTNASLKIRSFHQVKENLLDGRSSTSVGCHLSSVGHSLSTILDMQGVKALELRSLMFLNVQVVTNLDLISSFHS
jgi:hypothetical protein